MTERKSQRVVRDRYLTAEEGAKYRAIREGIAAEKVEINAAIRRHRTAVRQLEEIFTELRRERESQGLSLSDMQDRTGIDRSTISKLETGQRANYTLETILRYADALGKQVLVSLAEKS